jgi:hypothetical protein
MPIRMPIQQPGFESPDFNPRAFDRQAFERRAFDPYGESAAPDASGTDDGLGRSGARWMVAMALGLMMVGVAFSL